MISKFDQLNELFADIDKNLTVKVHFHIIGGAVMVYHGLKPLTKDIDIVVDTQKEFIMAERALKSMGFIAKLPTAEYTNFDLNQILIKGDFRIDLFQKSVCKGFVLSDGMKKRAIKIKALENLTVSLCSTTDTFMFKTFTEREGDLADCISLVQSGIEWESMIDEINKQIDSSGNKVWIS